MKRLNWIGKHILEFIAGIAFFAMISVVFFNVILRFTTGNSLVWSEEVAAIGFIWTIFIGAAVCYKERGGLISVDMLIQAFPIKWCRIATLIVDLFQVVFCIVLCVLGWKFAMSAANKTSLCLKLPYTVYDIPVAISFAFMAYYAVKRVIEDVKSISSSDEDTKKEGTV